jgi:uncharacterized membrane protein YgdD (TMEM256/DUF423 family)
LYIHIENMIVDNIEIVTFFVILLFLIPVLWNLYKSKFHKYFSVIELIKLLNSALKVQVIFGIVLLPLIYISNTSDSLFYNILIGTAYTYVVIGVFIYSPSLMVLNLIKVLIQYKQTTSSKR